MSKRLFLVIVAFLAMAGCAPDKRAYDGSSPPQVTTATTDCSPYRWSYGLLEYILLSSSALSARVEFEGSSAFAILGDSQPREEADKAARAKADEVNSKLDGLNREAETGKANAGACFDVGNYGKDVAEQYALTKETIAEQRKAVAEELESILARNKAIDEERTSFERWRAENRTQLVRHVGGMKVEIVRIAKRDLFGRPASETLFTIEATNTTTSRIVTPRNQRVWGYEFGSDVGGRLPIGASLTDSFGNDYKLTGIDPSYLGNEAEGIRPGQTVTFRVRFGDVPLQNAKSVRLVVEPATFGQQARTEFEIPSEAFYGAVTKLQHVGG